MALSLCKSTVEHDSPIVVDPRDAARSAGLRYYSDARPGIRRKRAGKHFCYVGLDGIPIRQRDELRRIKEIGIPPAWSDVWICPSPRGHIQATGRDVRGRKQYRYHPRWRKVRDETKYDRLIEFGEALPHIRERTSRALAARCLSRERVLATVVQLLDATAIRVGNEEYARENRSFGLTTLQTRHVAVDGTTIRFTFRGKSGKEHVVGVRSPRLARAVKRCKDLPGYELFQYLDDDGQRHAIDSADVNEYLRDIAGNSFSAKDFRTWHGTVRFACALWDRGPFYSEAEAKTNIVAAIAAAAEHLGNTAAICRKSYIHPGIIDAYLAGSLFTIRERLTDEGAGDAISGLTPEEAAVLAILRGW